VTWIFVLGSLLLVLVLRWVPVPASSVIAQSWIKALWVGDGAVVRYDWTAYQAISPNAALAVIAGEDQRFPHHYGFDFVEIRDALEDQEFGTRWRIRKQASRYGVPAPSASKWRKICFYGPDAA